MLYILFSTEVLRHKSVVDDDYSTFFFYLRNGFPFQQLVCGHCGDNAAELESGEGRKGSLVGQRKKEQLTVDIFFNI